MPLSLIYKKAWASAQYNAANDWQSRYDPLTNNYSTYIVDGMEVSASEFRAVGMSGNVESIEIYGEHGAESYLKSETNCRTGNCGSAAIAILSNCIQCETTHSFDVDVFRERFDRRSIEGTNEPLDEWNAIWNKEKQQWDYIRLNNNGGNEYDIIHYYTNTPVYANTRTWDETIFNNNYTRRVNKDIPGWNQPLATGAIKTTDSPLEWVLDIPKETVAKGSIFLVGMVVKSLDDDVFKVGAKWAFGFKKNAKALAKEIKGYHLNDMGEYKNPFKKILSNPKNEIHFSLDDMDLGLMSEIMRPRNSATNWELNYLYSQKAMFEKTIFHYKGKSYIGYEAFSIKR